MKLEDVQYEEGDLITIVKLTGALDTPADTSEYWRVIEVLDEEEFHDLVVKNIALRGEACRIDVDIITWSDRWSNNIIDELNVI